MEREYPDAKVERVRGGLLELSVSVDDVPVYDGGSLAYPRPTRVVDRVREGLGVSPAENSA